ncbi:hypothetical protein JOQ06_029076 [Pogonophryne albipinna]|uniref:Helicase C-terminal domain-containing protein n=1 Tax=Pogonophryne albipinna TaxID=1090488 RepID=A0AAD6BA68_9TELE|nr:hypothetical protein JOQ06_029076 [Pogonophryne albipinna]
MCVFECIVKLGVSKVLDKFMSRLVQNRVMSHKDLRSLSKYQIILARDQFRKNPPPNIKARTFIYKCLGAIVSNPGPQQGMLEGDFALCISLYHGYELLMQMGLRSLFFYIQGIMDGTREMSRARNELQRTPTFVDLYHEMEAMFVKPSAGPGEPFIYSHPKLKKLDEVVLQHFKQAESLAESKGPQEVGTRVMIFSSFRESVQEIADMLNHHAPLIRVMTFMGQASAGKGVKGFTQKEQLEVMSRFRQGGYNTLVSTCVGEEGLDIGEVDLIVCFDAQKNPIRLVQRMGRTGRKRQGRIVVILAEGREDRTYNQSMSNKRSVDKSIIGNRSGFHMFPNSPRMLPEGLNPTLHKMHITCGQFDHQESNRRSIRGRRFNSEGRVSLIHPQNLIRQGSSTSDGFLSSTEYSLWAATMKLGDDEAHPTLKPSRFLSIPGDLPPQDDVSKSRPASRELSLWEWRHWQHKALPTHVVDHSLRCNHFIKVMELIDSMREEKEGECRYEQELLPYLHKANAVGHVQKGPKQKQKGSKSATKTNNGKAKPRHSTLSDLECIEEEEDWQNTRGKSILSSFAATKEKLAAEHVTEAPNDGITDRGGPEGVCPLPSNNDCPEADMDYDSVIVNEQQMVGEPVSSKKTSQLKLEEEEDVELQAMFYLPKWDSAIPPSFAKLLSGRDQSLKVILANVAELLSRSPPPLIEDLEADMAAPSLPPSPQQPHQPFHDQQQSVSMGSPTWEEVFGEEEENNNHDIGHDHKETDHEIHNEKQAGEEAKKYKEIEMTDDAMTEEKESCWVDERNQEMPISTHGGVLVDAQMDDSMDLFGDDEDFLQMTIPEISTPGGTSRMSLVQQNSESCDSSHDYFPVNFDLGYSLEDSDEAEEEAVPALSILTSPLPKEAVSTASPRAVSNSSTPSYSFHRQKTPLQSSESKISTPQMLSEHRKRETASFLASPLVSRYGAVPSPITSQSARRTLASGITGPRIQSLFPSLRQTQLENSPPHPVERVSDSDDEVVVHKRRAQSKVKPLSSPEVSKISSDVDSPLVVKRKRTAALNTSDEMEDQTVSDDDFQNVFTHRNTAHGAEREPVQQSKAKHPKCRRGRQFLDEEAKLSEEEGSDVSSDEEDGEDQNHSLEGFVVDNTHCSQGLNDSEMQGVYLKSVRSPAVHGKFKLSYKNHNNMDIFSQVPEMDETYAEDSFVVGNDEEEGESSEQEAEDIELMPEESYVEGRRQYATRRRVFLHKARAGAKATPGCPPKTAGVKTKRTRVIQMNDSSDEEMEEAIRRSLATEGGVAAPLWPQAAKRSSVSAEQQNERHRRRLENQHLLSDELDFAESDLPVSSKKQPQVQAPPAPSSKPQTSSAQSSSVSAPPVCILVDSRCLSGGSELMTSLRQRHAATLHVCSLDGSYFIVSNRTAVEKHSQSDLAATQNRKRLAERVNSLQGLFERVCLIVEKDRSKPGEASRPFQRTRCYDSTLTALVSTGVRLLWSDGAEQSAGLLADLARLEQRKGQAIGVPLEVKGSHRQQALQLYLGLPSCPRPSCSSIEAIQKGGSMSRSRAEEIYRFLRYSCDSFMMNSSTAGKSN